MSFVQSCPADSTRNAAFQSTLWSQVRVAGRLNTTEGGQALEELCRAYWQPIYAFLRRCGNDPQAAKDFTQGFFVYLMETELLRKANPDRGRFRSFLLGSLKYFVLNQQARERALKRGGNIRLLPIDDPEVGQLAMNLTPEQAFDRKWALAVLNQTMKRLAAEYARGGMSRQFKLLEGYLLAEADGDLGDLAARLGKSESATRVLVFRLRNRFRKLVRAVIADTVSNIGQVEEELRHLEAALRDT
jgi:RNA polymerase sigma factor (sigma-70 family)